MAIQSVRSETYSKERSAPLTAWTRSAALQLGRAGTRVAGAAGCAASTCSAIREPRHGQASGAAIGATCRDKQDQKVLAGRRSWDGAGPTLEGRAQQRALDGPG